MVERRLLLALPLLLAPTRVLAQPVDPMAQVLARCWQARGVNFSRAAVAARIGTARGMAALLAVAGAAISDDGEEVETAVEIVWRAGAAPSPAEYLLHRDLAAGLPALLIHRDGRALLLLALDDTDARTVDPAQGLPVIVPITDVALIGRPVIAGA